MPLLVFFLLFGLLSACSEKPQGDEHFPLQKGLSWTYIVSTTYPDSIDQSRLTIENLGKQKFDDKSYFVRRTSSGIDYYLNFDELGVYREGLRTLVELKPRLDRDRRYVIKYPLVLGTNWSEITRPLILMRVFPYKKRAGDGTQLPLSYQIESLSETVEVPAGVFENCIKVVGTGIFEVYTDGVNGYSEIPISVEEWYAPGVGLVKQIRHEMDGETISITDTPVFVGGNTSLVLEKFSN